MRYWVRTSLGKGNRLLFQPRAHRTITATPRKSACPLFLLSLVIGVTLATGCARLQKAPSVPAPAPITAQELAVRLQERGAAIQTMKAQFSIEATGKDIKGTQRMEAAMVYQRPNAVRLRTFARIGLLIFDLTLINDRYQVKIPMQGKFLTGRVTELSRQEGVSPSILLGLQATVGNLNGTAISSSDSLTLREEGDLYVLEVIPSEEGIAGPRRLWFDQRTLDLVRQEFLGPFGETQASIVFQDYRPVGTTLAGVQGEVFPIVRPYVIRAEDSLGRAKLVLTFREIVPNPELSPQDWGMPGNDPLADRDFFMKGAS